MNKQSEFGEGHSHFMIVAFLHDFFFDDGKKTLVDKQGSQ
jgi:hypothetical protein